MGIFVNKAGYLLWERAIPVLVLLVVGLFIGMSSVVVVGAGEVGVVDMFGSVDDTELKSGIQLKNPFAGVKIMSIKTQEYTMSYTQGEGAKYGSDTISALTKEGLSVDLDITILYKLTPYEASDIYQEIGLDYVSIIVRPQIRTVIREVVANYEAKQIYSSDRAVMSDNIFMVLEPVLMERGIILESVLLRHVQLPQQLTNAIEQKLTAEQNIEKRQFEVEIEFQEAERKRVEAQGIADSNAIIADSLSENYLRWYWIDNLETHNSVIYVPVGEGGMPIFKNVDS